MPRLGRQSNFTGALDAVVVIRGDAERVARWVEQGTVPAYVVDLDGPWCAVVAAGPGHAAAPFDDAATVLVARPVPQMMRPAAGFFVHGDDAVVLVQPRRWRSLPRWFVVRRGFGVVRAALPQASLADLLAVGEKSHPETLERVLAQRGAEPIEVLRGVMVALGIPAGHLLALHPRAAIEADLVEPDAKAVRRFDKHTREEREERREIEGHALMEEKR